MVNYLHGKKNCLTALATVAALGSLGTEAIACVPVHRVIPPVDGETFEEMHQRSRVLEQEEFRAASTTIFLAEVSSERRVGPADVETVYTPVRVFSGDALPEPDLTARIEAGNTCRRAERVSDLLIVYAARSAEGWSIAALRRPDEIVDPAIRAVLRDALRDHRRGRPGELPPPVYPD